MAELSIVVDGIDYNVSHDKHIAMEFVEVADVNDELVAVAIIDLNLEHIEVRYFNDEELTTSTYNFFEYYHSPDNVIEISTWMAATHPING